MRLMMIDACLACNIICIDFCAHFFWEINLFYLLRSQFACTCLPQAIWIANRGLNHQDEFRSRRKECRNENVSSMNEAFSSSFLLCTTTTTTTNECNEAYVFPRWLCVQWTEMDCDWAIEIIDRYRNNRILHSPLRNLPMNFVMHRNSFFPLLKNRPLLSITYSLFSIVSVWF